MLVVMDGVEEVTEVVVEEPAVAVVEEAEVVEVADEKEGTSYFIKCTLMNSDKTYFPCN
jgi:hypothetical protein